MPYCQHCGGEVDQLPGAAAAESVSAEVEIEKIRAEKEIAIARITARQDRDWNETRLEVATVEAEAEVAAAEATAEIIGEVLASDDEPAEEAEPAPVVLDDVPEPEPDLAPPVVDEHESHGPKKSGWGFS